MQVFSINIKAGKGNLFQRMYWLFKKKSYTVSLPESWEEMEQSLIPAICKELMDRKNKESSALNICQSLCKLPNNIFLNINPLDYVEKILPIIDWIFERSIEKPYLQSILHKNIEFCLPSERLLNITWKEFTIADMQYSEVVKNKSVEVLNEFVAILLREKSNDVGFIDLQNDKRVALTEWGTKTRANEFIDLKEEFKFYVLYFFMSCKEAIHEQYKAAWESNGTVDTGVPSFENWESITTDIAETGIFGNLQEVEDTNAHKILKWLDIKKKRAAKTAAKSVHEQILANHNSHLYANR